MIVRAFDGARREVVGDIEIPLSLARVRFMWNFQLLAFRRHTALYQYLNCQQQTLWLSRKQSRRDGALAMVLEIILRGSIKHWLFLSIKKGKVWRRRWQLTGKEQQVRRRTEDWLDSKDKIGMETSWSPV